MATLREIALVTLSAAALTTTIVAAASVASAGPDRMPLAPCYNGIVPQNPYANNCALPSRPHRVLGSAPDQTALLNCGVGSQALRAICLSQYVNGGTGGYSGFVFGRG